MKYQEYLKENEKRNKEILKLRKAGMSLNRIATLHSISRQRVAQIIKSYPQEQEK